MTGSAGALDALMAKEVEIPFSRMVDSLINNCASQCISISVLIVVCWEKPLKEKNVIKVNRTNKQTSCDASFAQ